jgi:hypothetical protein
MNVHTKTSIYHTVVYFKNKEFIHETGTIQHKSWEKIFDIDYCYDGEADEFPTMQAMLWKNK